MFCEPDAAARVLTGEAILARLLALNLEKAATEGGGK